MESKRKSGASLAAPLAGRRMHASMDWASLPIDMVRLVTDRLLHSGDIVDYVAFRAVCSAWRASAPTPRERDPALRDPRLRPRDWIALCGGDSVPPDDTGEIELFHTRTARRVCVRVPDLRDHRIVGFSQGLLVLVHKATAEIRVLHPFTCVAVDFPSLAPVYSEAIKYTNSFLQMNAAVCSAASSSSSIAVVLCVPYMHYVLAAEAGSDHWDILHPKLDVSNTLVFQGRLYGTTIMPSRWEIVQLYPTTRSPPTLDLPVTVARAPSIPVPHHIFLVASRGQMLLVALAQHHFALTVTVENISAYRPTEWWKDIRFTMYEVNLNNNGDAKLLPVSCLLDRALFLSDYGCLSVSAIDLPSLAGNSIYFSVGRYPVLMHSLTTGLFEELAVECQIHDGDMRIRPSVRPFTIIDHLLTFCHPNEWTKGLMFHEYHEIPTSFKELLEKISAKWWEYKFRPSQAVHMGRPETKRQLEDAATSHVESTEQ